MEQVTAATVKQAGKVIAVHLSYQSRADQRGRTPAKPSYFLKASSSLSLTDSKTERPAGCELLAYEGEIALVIGTAARRVSVEDAWSHVGYVTASNDLGVYDLKYADKGSNVRSKSGDGFTPFGPGLIPAADVNPTALRVRTWINGEPVQDDTTAGLIFPFSQIVADLSQLMTLDPGDVILTGTPAGSSVAVPGDVIEVEVSSAAPDLSTAGSNTAGSNPAGLSTGRLRTVVVQGETQFADFGNGPKATDSDREDAYGSAEAAGLTPKGLSAELKRKLTSVGTATLSAQLRKRGLNNVSIDGLKSTRPELRIAGTARTLRYVPNREDLFKAHGGGYNAQKRIINTLNDGDVLVMEARGEPGTGTVGDILALRAQVKGAAAIVTDGGVRDVAAVAALDMPTFFTGSHPAVLGRKHIPWDTDLTISCGGATVQPGDIIVGDADGVLVIPPSLAEEVADDAITQEHEETYIAEMVAEGNSVEGLYPMNAAWKSRFADWATTHPNPAAQP
ncbi:fumarylacetoacetate hydrolase family protein [Paeniglutamicibacter antarcticus]|uniref:Fumarylacetoacetate hydrolase family protein n=1 Tax=Arthrobacter terrae TaxID=2935737 RepID=A0A931G413_9MICC|nr:fumarylacetoacetate hydrolase family protein [Arthrobacter terrae]MBG0737905.1 fumarylacetoacetate hydrolase family protein [Arthrobacter terrae]